MLVIRKERLERAWTQKIVANYIGLTTTAVSDIENGKQRPSYSILCKIETLFGMSHKELFSEVENNL